MTSEEASTQSKLRPKKIRGSAIVRHLVKYVFSNSLDDFVLTSYAGTTLKTRSL